MPENTGRAGAWKPGQSGNPGGRPKEEREVLQLARDASPAAIRRLVELMDCDSPRAAIAAANSILDRAFGKPAQTISGDPDKPLSTNLGLDTSGLSEAVLRALASVKIPQE
jgi:hypothetical protein